MKRLEPQEECHDCFWNRKAGDKRGCVVFINKNNIFYREDGKCHAYISRKNPEKYRKVKQSLKEDWRT